MTKLKLISQLQERADYISYLELSLMNCKAGLPMPPKYKLENKSFYLERARRLNEY